jgi:hypothetical protein
MRVRVKNGGATGFDGRKVTNEATITLWVSKAFKEGLKRHVAGLPGEKLSVSEFLRRLAKEDMA